MVTKLTQEQFVAKAVLVHGDKYDYSGAAYCKNSAKVFIVCAEHGAFEQTPAGHLKGRGCARCGTARRGCLRRLTQNEFLAEAVGVHGDRYDYSSTVYIKSNVKTSFACKEHGIFKQTPNAHLAGNNGCRKCSSRHGYDTNKPGLLYILQCPQGISKIGITNVSVRSRLRDVCGTSGLDFSELKVWKFDDGTVASRIETLALAVLRQTYKQPSEKFSGYTECFICEAGSIEQLVTQLLKDEPTS